MFDSFCKKVLKYKARDYYAEQRWRGEREMSLSELSERELSDLSATDQYFADEYVFDVSGQSISVSDCGLAEALNTLPAARRDIILLSYFLGMTDTEIGQLLNIVRRTVTYRRANILQELKKVLEENADE